MLARGSATKRGCVHRRVSEQCRRPCARFRRHELRRHRAWNGSGAAGRSGRVRARRGRRRRSAGSIHLRCRGRVRARHGGHRSTVRDGPLVHGHARRRRRSRRCGQSVGPERAQQTREALRLAANIPLGLRAAHGSSSKPFLCGLSARLGLEVALAARAGVAGQPNTFTGPFGFIPVVNGGLLYEPALRDLGHRFGLISPGVAFKFYPLCSATQAAVEATVALRSAHVLNANRVASVVCRATMLVVSCLAYAEPTTGPQAQFSMSFAIACALLHGTVGIDHLDAASVTHPDTVDLMRKVVLVEDEHLVAPNERLKYPEAATVVITLQDGTRVEHTVLAATGMPHQPATRQQLERKFLDCASRSLAVDLASELLDRLRRLPQMSDTRMLLPFRRRFVTGAAVMTLTNGFRHL